MGEKGETTDSHRRPHMSCDRRHSRASGNLLPLEKDARIRGHDRFWCAICPRYASQCEGRTNPSGNSVSAFPPALSICACVRFLASFKLADCNRAESMCSRLQSRLAQVRLAQVRPAQVRPAQVRPAQVRLAQVRLAQVRLAQVRPVQVRPAQVRLAQVRPAQVRPAQVRPVQVRLAQVRPVQVRLAQVRLAQVRLAQVRPVQVRLGRT